MKSSRRLAQAGWERSTRPKIRALIASLQSRSRHARYDEHVRLLFLLTSSLALAGEFSTAIGDAYPYTVQAMTTDAAGNTYLTGNRTLSSGVDVFVTKLDPTGAVVFTNTFGANTVGYVIAVDPSGNIYVGGSTASPDFLLTNALQTQAPNAPTGFLVKLSSDGAIVIYSTYFGGTEGTSQITSLAADAKGNLFIAGWTNSSDFPQTSSLPGVPLVGQGVGVMGGVMVAQLSPTGNLVFSAVLAPVNNQDFPRIALDAADNVYVVGYTYATNLPTTTGVITPSGGPGAFIAKIKPGATGFAYLTYFGPSTYNVAGMAVDAAGNVYISGSSLDPTFPVTTGALAPFAPGVNVYPFTAKLNPSGSALVFGTLALTLDSLAVDANGKVWGTSFNTPTILPNANGWTTGPEYVAGLSADGSSLIYSARFPSGTVAQAASVDGAGLVHVAGNLGFVSAINPAAPPSMKVFAVQNGFLGSLSARVSPAEVVAIYGPGIGAAAPMTATSANNRYPTSLGGVSVQVNGTSIPLLYISATQINAVIPMELATNAGATIQITNKSATTAAFPLRIVPSAGVAFSSVFNSDWTVNSSNNPAHAGSYVTVYATGAQQNFAPLVDGQIATAAKDLCNGLCGATLTAFYPPICVGFCFAKPAVSSASVIAPTLLYGGTAPGAVAGITQFNVQVGTAGQTFTVPWYFILDLTVFGTNVAISQISIEPQSPDSFYGSDKTAGLRNESK